MRITFKLERAFDNRAFENKEQVRFEAALYHLADALILINRDYIGLYPLTPRLYHAGIRYIREPIGREEWLTIPAVLNEGGGDCEDLACWLIADYQQRDNVNAQPIFLPQIIGEKTLYHVIVKLPDGRYDDPSRKLGMGWRE